MSVTTAIATYFLIWWVVLFAVLPWGVSAQGTDASPGTDPGAPAVPRLLSKLLWTTVVATLVFAVFAMVYINGLIRLDSLTGWVSMPRP
jgi:predicted secreted protein